MSWGWLEGRKGALRGRDGARPQRGIYQRRTDTGTCAVGHVAHGRRHLELLEGGREGGDWVPLPPLLARVFLEVVVKGSSRTSALALSSGDSRYRLRVLGTLVSQIPLTVLKWRRRLLGRNNTGRNYFLLQSSTSAEGARKRRHRKMTLIKVTSFG